jgi:hypothetical protein
VLDYSKSASENNEVADVDGALTKMLQDLAILEYEFTKETLVNDATGQYLHLPHPS